MIIGLLGLANSGKDTTADFLVKNHNFVKVALADPLKRIAKDAFAFTDSQLWGPSELRNAPDERYRRLVGMDAGEPEYGFLTPRYALQQLGSEWGRDCYPNVWIDYALRVADRMSAGGHTYTAQRGLNSFSLVGDTEGAFDRSKRSVVISDVRFKNEVAAIKAAGGLVWKIERSHAGLTGEAAAHMSETEQLDIPHDEFFCVIKNDRSLQALDALATQAFALSKKHLGLLSE